MVGILDLLLMVSFLTGVYMLLSYGFYLVYGVLRFLNVAHGEGLMIGSYISYWMWKLYRVEPLFSLPLVMVIMMIIFIAIYYLFAVPTLRKTKSLGEFERMSLLVTFGLILILQNLALLFWKADWRSISYLITPLRIGDVVVSLRYLSALVMSVVLTIILYVFLTHTSLGKIVRAIPQDKEAVSLMGINVERSNMLVFAIAGILVGVASTTISFLFIIYPAMGFEYSVICFFVIVIGGIGNIKGVPLGAFVLALSETLASFLIGGIGREIAAFALIFLILLVRPSGILGE